MDNQTVLDDIGEILQQKSQSLGINISLKPLFNGINPFLQEEQSELVELVTRLTEKPTESVAFGTEAPYLKQMGFETVVLGPGSIDQAHQPNEFLALDAIKPAQKLIKPIFG